MNKEWSEKNKKMQSLIGKKESFEDGIAVLLELRENLFSQITSIVNTYPKEAFYRMPFAGAKGYHSKTLAYSLYYILINQKYGIDTEDGLRTYIHDMLGKAS